MLSREGGKRMELSFHCIATGLTLLVSLESSVERARVRAALTRSGRALTT